jgi:OmpA-OmpF porin, OOP family
LARSLLVGGAACRTPQIVNGESMRMRMAVWVGVLVLAAFAVPGQAAAAGWYSGLSVGYSEIHDPVGEAGGTRILGEELAGVGIDFAGTARLDESDVGWKVLLGYQFNRFIAVEGGFASLGKFEAEIAGTADGLALAADTRTEVEGLNLVAVAMLPLGQRFSLFGKGGLYGWRATTRFALTLDGEPVDVPPERDEDLDYTFGAGFKWQFSRAAAIRVEWERFRAMSEDIDLISIGIQIP